jgi:peptidoglycan/LPS O-acetylase OafA/YrhL
VTLVASYELSELSDVQRAKQSGTSEPRAQTSPLNYRPDIDGLRAVAVLSVLACHLEIFRMAGGFVGVDVFFVISGYLISSIVFSEIADSRFSILSFYERRIRRIFPALFAMLLAFSIFAILYFLPVELVNYSKSLFAATTSISNFYFWQHSSYFDAPLSNPLLHTWSLAVEEQFYIFFPIFLVIIRKFFPTRLRISIIVLFVASLLLSAIVVHFNRDTAFYMSYTRAWELLLGTILSLKMVPGMRALWLRNLATIIGSLMILYSVLYYTAATVFPGLSALLPCIGCALIISAGESGTSIVGYVLSLRPVVFVGLISYSLYLWHWPVIICQKMGLLFPMGSTLSHYYATLISPKGFDRIVETSLSFLLAVLSWRFVERPFRKGPLRLARRPLFVMAGAVVAIFIALSSLTIIGAGFKGRFSPDSVQLASYLDNKEKNGFSQMRGGTCFITGTESFKEYDYGTCLHQRTDESNYLLLGDSHSAMLLAGLSSAFPKINIMQASTGGCQPFVHLSGSSNCAKMMNYIFDHYLPSHSVQALLLERRWEPNELNGLAQTIDWAQKHRIRIILFGPVPEYDAPLPRLEAYSIAWNKPDLVSKHRAGDEGHLDEQLQALAATWHVPYVSLYKAICSKDSCIEYSDLDNKVPLMYDTNHLSATGSLLVIRRLLDRGELSSLTGSSSVNQ